MKIESYEMMKITFEYYCSKTFSVYIKNPIFIICYNNYTNSIHSGYADSNIVDEEYENLYIEVTKDEMKNFNQKIYEEKIDELKFLIKKDKINKKIQKIEEDFV